MADRMFKIIQFYLTSREAGLEKKFIPLPFVQAWTILTGIFRALMVFLLARVITTMRQVTYQTTNFLGDQR